MSYNPSYGYPTNPNYYMQQPEDYLPDYSDHEALSDQQQVLQAGHPNLTEIYSRNEVGMGVPPRQMVTPQARYLQNQGQYVLQNYYENPPSQPARRLTAVPIQQDYSQTYDHRIHQYCPLATSSVHDTNYDAAAYQSAHHGMNVTTPSQGVNYQEVVHHPTPVQKQQGIKRYPVKVGTPKYYRKAASSGVYKRPSALCLSVTSQPDPAAHRKPKKPAAETQCNYPQDVTFANETTEPPLLKKSSEPVITDHKVGSEGDFSLKISKLEDMFEKIEKENDESRTKTKNDMAKFARFLKPRVPSSIKTRQEKMRLKSAKPEVKSTSADGKDAKIDVPDESETTSGDSIERLLNQLKKCELAICADGLDNKNTENNQSHNNESNASRTNENNKDIPASRTKSFNYQDITNQMMKSQTEVQAFERDENEHRSNVQDITRRLNLSMTTSRRSFVSKPPLDDHCALELHRSKSYIVNLIDRALSKELGTVPSSRNHKEFNDMSPRKAIDMMNKHSCGKTDKELCVEITSALTDSIISNATAPESADIHSLPSSSSRGKVCCCNSEEPTYIKQLKQLRWGHLKHIQREVRRLEDLERFLDSCSLNPISEI